VVVDARATRGVGGVEGVALGVAEVMGTTREAAELDEASNEGAALFLVVRLPSVAV
jgi:hypothetical protein